jgi:hypothetical protein
VSDDDGSVLILMQFRGDTVVPAVAVEDNTDDNISSLLRVSTPICYCYALFTLLLLFPSILRRNNSLTILTLHSREEDPLSKIPKTNQKAYDLSVIAHASLNYFFLKQQEKAYI